jgi:hypothetical protein
MTVGRLSVIVQSKLVHFYWSQDAKGFIPSFHYDSNLTEVFSKISVEAGFEIVDCQTRHWSYTYESSKDILGDSNVSLHFVITYSN